MRRLARGLDFWHSWLAIGRFGTTVYWVSTIFWRSDSRSREKLLLKNMRCGCILAEQSSSLWRLLLGWWGTGIQKCDTLWCAGLVKFPKVAMVAGDWLLHTYSEPPLRSLRFLRWSSTISSLLFLFEELSSPPSEPQLRRAANSSARMSRALHHQDHHYHDNVLLIKSDWRRKPQFKESCMWQHLQWRFCLCLWYRLWKE